MGVDGVCVSVFCNCFGCRRLLCTKAVWTM